MALAAACLTPHDSATCLRLTIPPKQARRAVLRAKSNKLVCSLERWRDHAVEAKALNAKVCRALPCLRLSTGILTCYCSEIADHGEAQARKIIQRLMMAGLVRCLERWQGCALERKVTSAKLLKSLRRLAQSGKSCSWRFAVASVSVEHPNSQGPGWGARIALHLLEIAPLNRHASAASHESSD
jgi:hypothetical protein